MSNLRSMISGVKTKIYRQPADELRRLWNWGPRAFFRIERWKQQMECAARTLPLIGEKPNTETVEIWFLTGNKFWYQTAFCCWTFAKHSRHNLRPIILDDGTLDSDSISGLRRLFPGLRLHKLAECNLAFAESLPASAFPNLHRWRQRQLLFRKLSDIHANSSSWRLFFDSDMLFFRCPEEIDEWLDAPDRGLVQRDCWESYGYSRALTEKLCGAPLPQAANIGIFALNGSHIDWQEIEDWLGKMEDAEGAKYNVTQCTAAMLLSRHPLRILNSESYKVWPTVTKNMDDQQVLSHYVSDSKPWYFGEAWKIAMQAGNCSS